MVRKGTEADDMAATRENALRMTEAQIPDGPFDLQTRETRGSVPTRAPALSNPTRRGATGTGTTTITLLVTLHHPADIFRRRGPKLGQARLRHTVLP